MRKVPITLSLPENLVKDLHLYISHRGISKFVAESLEKELETKKMLLAEEFKQAANDKERQTEIDEWDELNDDGLNEKNSY